MAGRDAKQVRAELRRANQALWDWRAKANGFVPGGPLKQGSQHERHHSVSGQHHGGLDGRRNANGLRRLFLLFDSKPRVTIFMPALAIR